MDEALDADLFKTRSTVENQQLFAATHTVELNPHYRSEPQAGKAIAALLPRFT
ncbi:unnamed protein product, partial [Heterosigma akashiwo]